MSFRARPENSIANALLVVEFLKNSVHRTSATSFHVLQAFLDRGDGFLHFVFAADTHHFTMQVSRFVGVGRPAPSGYDLVGVFREHVVVGTQLTANRRGFLQETAARIG